jgi:methylenetetrahydrofolate dehydrogenase (NADP+)/methenyltetrahydrofolate cyclohydrolase/formyltetrahydrofolate synthetase
MPNLKGAPTGFVPCRCAIFAPAWERDSYILLLGTMSTMPGLSTRPGYYEIDIDPETGQIIGLS